MAEGTAAAVKSGTGGGAWCCLSVRQSTEASGAGLGADLPTQHLRAAQPHEWASGPAFAISLTAAPTLCARTMTAANNMANPVFTCLPEPSARLPF